LKKIEEATIEELQQVGLPRPVAETLYQKLHEQKATDKQE
jgi:predicted transcriptional regulator